MPQPTECSYEDSAHVKQVRSNSYYWLNTWARNYKQLTITVPDVEHKTIPTQ